MANFDIAAHIFINEVSNQACETEEGFREMAKFSIKAAAAFEDEFDKHEREVNEPQQKHDDQIDSVASILEKALKFQNEQQKDIRDATLETLEKLLGPAPKTFKTLIKNVPNTPEINAILHSIKKNAEIQLAGM